MAEVVTFQIGSFSNFVGAHFWNIQQEQSNRDSVLLQKQQQDELTQTSGIKSSAVWSEHANNRRQTVYRPRLVAVDLEGALGGLHDSVANEDTSSVCWAGKVTKLDPHSFDSISKHPFIRALDNEIPSTAATPETATAATLNNPALSANQNKKPSGALLAHNQFNFSSSVRYFTDFFIPEWEPQRHMALVPNCFYERDQFDSYAQGQQLTSSEEPGSFWDNVTDKFRNQFELSDQMAAIHVLVDWDTGFGGIGSSVVEWLAENVPKTPIVVYANQAYEEPVMAEAPAHWPGFYRRVGGGLFVKTCIDELCHDWNSVILSDLNLASAGRRSSDKQLSLGQLDFKSRYESSALPGLALDLLSMPYRLEGCKSSAAREMLESTHINSRFVPFMSLHLGCPIVPDLFLSLPECPSLSFIERLWDVSTSPMSQPSGLLIPITRGDSSSMTQYCIGRGLTQDQHISLVSQLPVKDRCMHHPDGVPIPVTFPQFNKDPTSPELVAVSALACMRSMASPKVSKVFTHLCHSIHHVVKSGRSAALESHDDLLARSSVSELNSQFTEILHSEDSVLDFD